MLEQLQEDIKQYQDIKDTFDKLQSEYIDVAYDLAKDSLLLADRWNEIMLDSAKYCTLIGTTRTLFEKWAYHKYRILMTVHEFSRVVWRQGKEEYKNGFINE